MRNAEYSQGLSTAIWSGFMSRETAERQLPFPHVIIDNYFPTEIAKKLESQFPDYEDPDWWVYDNSLENKKTLNNWARFPAETYKAFQKMCTEEPGSTIADYGLHGGGWHISTKGGNLNTHLDYQIHPKLGLERKMNLIVYLSSDWVPAHGGRLGFWSGSAEEPKELVKVIEPRFNRAVMFDTSQNSWHGMVEPYIGTFRKSLAVYYLCEPREGGGDREKALFSARKGQGDEVRALIERRLRGEYT